MKTLEDQDDSGIILTFSDLGLTDMPNQICYRFLAYPQALGGAPDLLVCLHPSLIHPVVEGLYFEDDKLLADPLEDFGAFWPPLREVLWPTSKG